jgi:hypothetical protein
MRYIKSSDMKQKKITKHNKERIFEHPQEIIKNKSEQKSNNMEEYHSHTMHQKRRLKDYLFEFIMLFIAITCGFFADNLRDNMLERRKEKEYVVGLIGDIKEDTTSIRNFLSGNKRQILGLNSLITLLEKPILTIQYKMFIELTAKYLNNYNGFTPRDQTMIQLKNSSELRIFKDNSVSNKIVNYYSTIDYYHELNVKMNYRYIEDTYKLELQFLDFNPKRDNMRLNASDINKLKELYNRSLGLKSAIGWDNHWLGEVYDQGASLLEYLEKEYNLKQ